VLLGIIIPNDVIRSRPTVVLVFAKPVVVAKDMVGSSSRADEIGAALTVYIVFLSSCDYYVGFLCTLAGPSVALGVVGALDVGRPRHPARRGQRREHRSQEEYRFSHPLPPSFSFGGARGG
jgi:hypothetical protein